MADGGVPTGIAGELGPADRRQLDRRVKVHLRPSFRWFLVVGVVTVRPEWSVGKVQFVHRYGDHFT
jgi:hypothetical protein